jgi:4-aminobutyrate aminotransferase-like enzyme
MGSAAVMDAWGASTGEAIHTQTFLGNPTGCAMALATLGVIEDEGLREHARREGAWLANALASLPGVLGVRGGGLMVAPELGSGARSLAASRGMLRRGWIVLPAGEDGEVLAFTPPLTIQRPVLEGAVAALAEVL